MANLLRLSAALLLALVVAPLFAAVTPVYKWDPGFGLPLAGSADAACAAQVAYLNTNSPNAQRSISGGATITDGAATCPMTFTFVPGGTVYNGSVTVYRVSPPSCPDNSTIDGNGQCQCNAPAFEEKDGQCRPKNPCGHLGPDYEEQGGACVPKECKPPKIRVNGVCVDEPPCDPGETRVNGKCKKNGCEAGKSLGEYETNGDNVSYLCQPYGGKNCMVRINPSVCVTADGHKSCWGAGKMTGATCTPGSSQPGDGGPGSGPGEGPGGGNGPGTGPGTGGSGPGPGGGDNDSPGTGPTQPPVQPPPPVPPDPNTGQCPAGSVRYSNGNCYAPTPPPTTPDGNGSCPPGTVKVGTSCVSPSPPGKPVPDTGTPSNPNPGEGGGDGDGDGDDGSMFSGSCMGGFTCEGDAIQCAIAREQHRRACKLFDDKSAESDLYDKEKGKQGEQTKDLPGNKEESMANRISTADAFGSGQCIQDLSVVVAGHSISLPMSKICPSLAIIGNIMVAVSLLLAIRIVGRG